VRRHRPVESALDVAAPEPGPSVLALAFSAYWSLAALLEARGLSAERVHNIALRTVQAMLICDGDGLPIWVAAKALSTTPRTVERDLTNLRLLGPEALEPSVHPPIPGPIRRVPV
jgi:hypothetical protein